MRPDYASWLRAQGYAEPTVTAQLHRAGRVEAAYGDLERHNRNDRLNGILQSLAYTADDKAAARPNPTLIPIQGDLVSNLATYRDAVRRYANFLAGATITKRLAGAAGSRPPARAPLEHAETLADFGLDGQAALEAVIATSQYRTLAQAVASLTAFSHPDTVVQTEGKALFPTVRGPHRRGDVTEISGRRVQFDDNRSPTEAFLWANNLPTRGRDNQFNHVWPASQDPDAYTALPNICMTPAFIAKLTDTHPEICALLARRSFDLFGWTPAGIPPPIEPRGYTNLKWADPLPPVADIKGRLDAAMATKPKSRTVMAARALGWLFGQADGGT